MSRLFERMASCIAGWAGRAPAFAIALGVIVAWAVTGPIFHWSNTWQLIINTGTTIVTFLMVFLIQNAQNRDAAAIQAKLDEIIRAVEGARNQFIGIEHFGEDELEEIRKAIEECEGDIDIKHRADVIARLIQRR